MDHSQRGGNNDSGSNPSLLNSMPSVLFREIHKNAFLKRHTSDRRTGFPRKSERVWVVFCVHDDVEPFLEIYSDQKVALTHKPDWFASLSNALHVSPTICGHEDEFEFAVTLSFQVVRLAAPSWESMMEWVETIRNKLREMKILCPKENVYSKMPEPKQPLLPTRDPNSPLPLPPEGPSTLLPGVELVHSESRNNSESNDNNDLIRLHRDNNNRINLIQERQINRKRGMEKEKRPVAAESTVPLEIPSSSSNNSEFSQNHTQNTHNSALNSNSEIHKMKPRTNRAATVPLAEPSTSECSSGSNITIIEVPSTSNNKANNSTSDSMHFSSFNNESDDESAEDVFLPHSSEKLITKPSADGKEDTHYEHIFLPSVPVTKPQIVHSSNPPSHAQNINKTKKPHSTSVMINSNASNFVCSSQDKISSKSTVNINLNVPISSISSSNDRNFAGESGKTEINCQQIQKKLEKVNISGLVPRLPAKSVKIVVSPSVPSSSKDSNLNEILGQEDLQTTEEQSSKTGKANNFLSYSQVKKIPKGVVKNDDTKNEENKNQNLSPLVSKRKISNLRNGETDMSRKSENDTGSNASQLSSINPKPNNMISNAQKILIYKNGSKNKNPNSSLQPFPSTSNNEIKNDISNPGPSVLENSKIESPGTSNNNSEAEPLDATIQPSVRVVNVEDIPLIGGHQRRRRRSSSSEPTIPVNTTSSRVIGGADRIRINVPIIPNYTSRDTDIRLPAPTRAANEPNVRHPAKLTLREDQVLRLRKEILHPGGVRVQLRKTDCYGSIAFVNALNRVWIAGWNHKEHPTLYHSFHIGDEVISVDNVLVRDYLDTQALVNHSVNNVIEFIIRRVPFGNVFLLHRSSEGQNLGIIQEGNTAQIKEIVPNSIAAQYGLTSKTPSSDRLSLTTWFITEINGRPLNLFFKNNEVRDRLNAVGKEISILVQPYDFIKQIKKELKSFCGYKTFTVQ